MHVLNILWVVFGIGLMLVLNLRFKINSMVALLLAALSGALCACENIARRLCGERVRLMRL